MGARRRELRTPCFMTRSRRPCQSQRLDGVTPHMSNWKMPWEMGEPSKVE